MAEAAAGLGGLLSSPSAVARAAAVSEGLPATRREAAGVPSGKNEIGEPHRSGVPPTPAHAAENRGSNQRRISRAPSEVQPEPPRIQGQLRTDPLDSAEAEYSCVAFTIASGSGSQPRLALPSELSPPCFSVSHSSWVPTWTVLLYANMDAATAASGGSAAIRSPRTVCYATYSNTCMHARPPRGAARRRGRRARARARTPSRCASVPGTRRSYGTLSGPTWAL